MERHVSTITNLEKIKLNSNNFYEKNKELQIKWLNYGYRLGQESLRFNTLGDRKIMSEVNKKELIAEAVDGTSFVQYYIKKAKIHNQIIGICIGIISTITMMVLFKLIAM